ncbi:MAG: DNA repair protein RadA, partial [Crocinitomicaceae bacterium]
MSKIKTAFFCKNCGHEAPKWLGKCPSCGEWNTFVEELKDSSPKSSIVAFSTSSKKAEPQTLQEIQSQ